MISRWEDTMGLYGLDVVCVCERSLGLHTTGILWAKDSGLAARILGIETLGVQNFCWLSLLLLDSCAALPAPCAGAPDAIR